MTCVCLGVGSGVILGKRVKLMGHSVQLPGTKTQTERYMINDSIGDIRACRGKSPKSTYSRCMLSLSHCVPLRVLTHIETHAVCICIYTKPDQGTKLLPHGYHSEGTK